MRKLLFSTALLFLSLPASALVILQYHHISEDTPKATSISPDLFEQHLDYLAEQGFDVIGLDELGELIRQDAELPDKTAVITFDDGYISVYENAWPRLKKRKMPFAVFINTEPHDQGNPQFMSWQQMQSMSRGGVIFANHTVSHPHLIRRTEGESANAWQARVWREVSVAEKRIETQLGQSHKMLAYPFGEYNHALQKLLAERGFLAFGQQSGPVGRNSHPQALPRFPFGGAYGDIADFATKVRTRPLPVEAVEVESEKGRALADPELPEAVQRPRLILRLEDKGIARALNCFASGQGRIDAVVEGNQARVQAPKPLPSGRSRYNCTAATGETGRFYWYSEMFIRRLPDGSWYPE